MWLNADVMSNYTAHISMCCTRNILTHCPLVTQYGIDNYYPKPSLIHVFTGFGKFIFIENSEYFPTHATFRLLCYIFAWERLYSQVHKTRRVQTLVNIYSHCDLESDCYTVSASLVVIGQSVGYEATVGLVPSLVWSASLNIDWGCLQIMCILGNLQCIVGSCDRWEFPTFLLFQRLLTVPCTALTAGNLPAVRAVHGDREIV